MIDIAKNLSKAGISSSEVNKITEELNKNATLNPEICWQQVVKNIFIQPYPFSIYKILYEAIYPQWNKLPAPFWIPDNEFKKTTNVGKFMAEGRFNNFGLLHRTSTILYDEIWESVAKLINIKFDQPYDVTVDISDGIEKPRWFKNGKLNIVNSCLKAKPSDIAIIESDDQGNIQKKTYDDLEKLVNKIAHSLNPYVKKGDQIAIVMPMNFFSIAIFLAIIKIGCCAVPLSHDQSIDEIKNKLSQVDVKAIFLQDDYKDLITSEFPFTVIMPSNNKLQKTIRSQDKNWQEFLVSKDNFTAVSCDTEDRIAILFISKDHELITIPWTQITPIKCASDMFFHHDIKPQDVICIPTSLGQMGAWLIFASLINNATIALYNQSPFEDDFGKFVEDAKVNILGVSPTQAAKWHQEKIMEKFDWSKVKLFHSLDVNENLEDTLYLASLINFRPIIDYRYNHDIAGTYITNIIVEPIAPCVFNTPAFGLAFVLLDKNGAPTPDGEVALLPPSLGLSTESLNKNHHKIFYEGMPKYLSEQVLRRQGDHIKRLENGFYRLQR